MHAEHVLTVHVDFREARFRIPGEAVVFSDAALEVETVARR
jgi:hypothetical protein